MLQVTDDSGFLAIITPATYSTFVSEDWKFEQLLAHFQKQMGKRSLLIWSTGAEKSWNVEIRLKKSRIHGYREVLGPLLVDGGKILLTNYESLTMAAQFEDVTLPEKHQETLLIEVPDGEYACRIVQTNNPDALERSSNNADFVIELSRSNELPSAWMQIPWFDPS